MVGGPVGDHAFCKPQQGQSAQGPPDPVNPSAQQIAQVVLAFSGSLDAEGGASRLPGIP